MGNEKMDELIDVLQSQIIEEENKLLVNEPLTDGQHHQLSKLEHALYAIGKLHSRADGPMMTTVATVDDDHAN